MIKKTSIFLFLIFFGIKAYSQEVNTSVISISKLSEILVNFQQIPTEIHLKNRYFTTTTTAQKEKFQIENIWKVESGIKVFMGFGAGPETMISLPKFSVLYFFPTDQSLRFFAGGEFTFWMFQAVWFAGDVTGGIALGPLTLEASLGAFYYPDWEANVTESGIRRSFFHMSLNPKIGLYLFDRVWLRLGPSFVFSKKYSDEEIGLLDIFKIGKQFYNAEILFNMPIYK